MIENIAVVVLLMAWALIYAAANVAVAVFILKNVSRAEKFFMRIPATA